MHEKPSGSPIETKAQMAKSQITDIVFFFAQTTEAYRKFKQSIVDLTAKLPALPPEQLASKCKKLCEQRSNLEILDQQMFDIISLAGSEIAQETMLDTHRIALAQANIASNKLARKLRALKSVLQKEEIK